MTGNLKYFAKFFKTRLALHNADSPQPCADTRSPKSPSLFALSRWPLFPLHQHCTATQHTCLTLTYPGHTTPPQVPKSAAAGAAKHRTEPNPAARLVQQGHGATEKEKFPVDKRAPPGSSGQVLASRLRPVVASPALLLMGGVGRRRARTRGRGRAKRDRSSQPCTAGRPARPPLPSRFRRF